MDIKTLILGKFAKRNNATGAQSKLLKSQSSEEQRQQLVDLVEETILPRLITLTGTDNRLELTVANGKVFRVFARIGSGEPQSVDLTREADAKSAQRKISGILGQYLATPEDGAFTFTPIKPPREAIKGLTAQSLFAAPEVPKPDPPLTRPMRLEHRISDKFLESVQKDITHSRSYGRAGSVDPPQPPEFSDAFSALYQKLSTPLGGPVLCVAMAHNKEQDTFAYVLDEHDGAVVELNRQRLGKICAAWNKLLGE